MKKINMKPTAGGLVVAQDNDSKRQWAEYMRDFEKNSGSIYVEVTLEGRKPSGRIKGAFFRDVSLVAKYWGDGTTSTDILLHMKDLEEFERFYVEYRVSQITGEEKKVIRSHSDFSQEDFSRDHSGVPFLLGAVHLGDQRRRSKFCLEFA